MRISENDLADARQSWGDGLIKISQIFESSGIDEASNSRNNHYHLHTYLAGTSVEMPGPPLV